MRRPSQRPRLILADDHRLVIDALRRALEADYRIAGVAADGDEVIHLLSRHAADVILLDLDMPKRCGLQLIPWIRRSRPDVRIVVLTMHIDRGLVIKCLQAGAHAFVPKDATLAELVFAIEEARAGREFVSPRVPKSTHRVSLDAEHMALQRLTERQQAVLLGLGDGRSAVEISRDLQVSPSTVTFHKQNIMKVLGFDDEATLMQYAFMLRTMMEPRGTR